MRKLSQSIVKCQLKHAGGIGELANQHFETPNETIYSSQDHSWMLKQMDES